MKKPPGKSSAEPTAGDFDLSIVAALAKIAGHHDLSEVEVEHAGLRVRVARERRAPIALSHVADAPGPAPPRSPLRRPSKRRKSRRPISPAQ